MNQVSEKRMRKIKEIRSPVLWGTLVVLFLAMAGTIGGWLGYRDGLQMATRDRVIEQLDVVREQYELAVQDYGTGRYGLARQRFEYVIAVAPELYPQAEEYLQAVLNILNATATFTPAPSTPTLTPTITVTPTHDLVVWIRFTIAPNLC